MATAARPSVRRLNQRVNFRYKTYLWAVIVTWIVLAALQIQGQGSHILSDSVQILPWVALVTLLNLLPVNVWQSTSLTVDLPVAVAAGLVLTPIETGLLGFIASFDKKEFRGQITPLKALFNRSQVGLADFLGSLVAHQLSGHPGDSAFAVGLALIILATILLANYILVGMALAIEFRTQFVAVIRRLRLGTMTDFALVVAAWAVLGAMLSALYSEIGFVALVAFVFPALLCRQALTRSQMYIDASQAYEHREQALVDLSRRIYEERTDERRLIAADLHDEVLQPLFKVSLMAQVLKADLTGGRLLEMDQDLPELLTAAEEASSTLRELIGDLRRSTLGTRGLATALHSLVRALSKETTASFHADIANVSASASDELAVYQIAKEAIANAITHSRANNIWIGLAESGDGVTLVIRDDGVGFDPSLEHQGHYGVHIMRERAALARAFLAIDSTPSLGCSVTLTVGA